jgi:[protein-PII] uridylyltransferase
VISVSKRSHLDKVLAHAERKLVGSGKAGTSDLLQLYKRFIKLENHRLKIEHSAGVGGVEIARRRADLLDVIIRHLFDAAVESATAGTRKAPDLSVVAIGGYGRGELNPFSDIDIMFLHPGKSNKVPARTSEIIEKILYLLWDVGFKVGHSTRTIPGAIAHANEDMLSKTSLLESRCIAGNEAPYVEFTQRFQEKCLRGHEEDYIRWRVENQIERHNKYGGTVYLQEPHIKNGCGGLRDYQNLLWITYVKEGEMSLDRLIEKKFLTESERRTLTRAYDFLLRVRTELHYQNKRPTDTLTLYFQGQIAIAFEYPQRGIVRKSEAFMRDYYRHTRNLFHITATVAERLSLPTLRAMSKPGVFNFLARRLGKHEEFDGFYAEDGLLFPARKDLFRDDPYRLMRLFQHAQQRHLNLAPELVQLIRRKISVVTRTFQYARAARETFEAILSRKGQVGRILRMMHEVDFLGRYLPEFGELTCLVQHEFFHRYTADEHTLVCIEKLDSLIDTEDEKLRGYRKLFQQLEDPSVLYLAILLHDTGKSSAARYHSEASAINAQRVAARLQLSPERRRELIFLVDNHMLLSSTAQRRNVEDPATIAEFARIVKDQDYLDALMLLTLADGQATVSDQKWSDWKESLVWQLYRETRSYLNDEAAFRRERHAVRDDLHAQVRTKMPESHREEIDVHFASMPERYFASYEASEIVQHVKLFHTFLTHLHKTNPILALRPATKWVAHPAQDHSEVLVCTWDREGLLARIAACFACANLNILSADIYTRSDNLVLDVFRVCTTAFQSVTEQRDIDRFEEALERSTTEAKFDFEPLLQRARKRNRYEVVPDFDFPTRITMANDVHPTYTLVDIETPDRLGLLYDVLKAFAAEKINIALSRIATEKGAAIDSFYVTDLLGRKIDRPQEMTALHRALQKACTGKAVTRKPASSQAA